MREDAFIEVDPIRCYHHGGAATPLADVHKYMRIYMPRSYEQLLRQYDVIVLSDAYRGAFTLRQLGWFKSAVVQEGLGLVMVGGLDSFGASSSRPAASWSGSIVEEILPVIVPPPAGHHNWIHVALAGGCARIQIEDHENEFIRSLPFQPPPKYTWCFNGQIVYQKEGSSRLARYILPRFGNPPCYVTWMQGRGRTFAMMHDWSGNSEFSRWDYYPDFAINLMLYLAGRELPEDYLTVHQYREEITRVAVGKRIILSFISFVESFGGNPERIDKELVSLDSMVSHAEDLYLENDFVSALSAARRAVEKLKEVEILSMKVKNQALFWVYVVEYLSVTGVALLSGFALWTLMVRRKLYAEVGVTRLAPK